MDPRHGLDEPTMCEKCGEDKPLRAFMWANGRGRRARVCHPCKAAFMGEMVPLPLVMGECVRCKKSRERSAFLDWRWDGKPIPARIPEVSAFCWYCRRKEAETGAGQAAARETRRARRAEASRARRDARRAAGTAKGPGRPTLVSREAVLSILRAKGSGLLGGELGKALEERGIKVSIATVRSTLRTMFADGELTREAVRPGFAWAGMRYSAPGAPGVPSLGKRVAACLFAHGGPASASTIATALGVDVEEVESVFEENVADGNLVPVEGGRFRPSGAILRSMHNNGSLPPSWIPYLEAPPALPSGAPGDGETAGE